MRHAYTVVRHLFMAVLVVSLLGCAGAGQTAGGFVDDSTITTKVKSKLFNDPVTSGWQISVRTDGGVVYLTGVVASSKEKARAGELAASVAGVKSVRNELTVK